MQIQNNLHTYISFADFPLLNFYSFFLQGYTLLFRGTHQTSQQWFCVVVQFQQNSASIVPKQFYWGNVLLKFPSSNILPLKRTRNWKQTSYIGIYVYAASNFRILGTGTTLFAFITSVNMLIKRFINRPPLFRSNIVLMVTKLPTGRSLALFSHQLFI